MILLILVEISLELILVDEIGDVIVCTGCVVLELALVRVIA